MTMLVTHTRDIEVGYARLLLAPLAGSATELPDRDAMGDPTESRFGESNVALVHSICAILFILSSLP
jgi:hypothetical protein